MLFKLSRSPRGCVTLGREEKVGLFCIGLRKLGAEYQVMKIAVEIFGGCSTGLPQLPRFGKGMVWMSGGRIRI